MGINVYPQPSDAGKPAGAKKLIFGGYSSLGVYSYTGTLPAGVYIAEIRLATTNSLIYVPSSGPNGTTSPVNQFEIKGDLGGTYASGIIPATFQPVGSNAQNNWLYTPQADFTYIRIPSTDTGITITGGYVQKTGTSVTNWTGATEPIGVKADITALDHVGNTISVGLSAPDNFNYRYFAPHRLYSEDLGLTWKTSLQTNLGILLGSWGLFSNSSHVASAYGVEYNVFNSSTITSGTSPSLRYAGDRYFFITNSGNFKHAYSKNLNEWEPFYTPAATGSTTQFASDVAYNPTNGTYAMGGGSTGTAYVFTSKDGFSWTFRMNQPYQPVRGMAYGNGVFVGSMETTAVVRSTDGITWTTVAATSDLRRGIYATRFVFAGNGNYFGHSTDGITWASVATGWAATGQPAPRDIAYGNSVYCAGNAKGDIARSTDGITWTTTGVTSNFASQAVNGIAYGASIFVAAGGSGTIRTSTDGLTWATRTSGTAVDLRGLTYGPQGFLAIGDSSTVLTSTDGITWVTHPQEAMYPVWTTVSGIQKKDYSAISLQMPYTGVQNYSNYDMATSTWNGLVSYSEQYVVSTSSNPFYKNTQSQSFGKINAMVPGPTYTMFFGMNATGDQPMAYWNYTNNQITQYGINVLLSDGNKVTVNTAIYAPQKSLWVAAGDAGTLSTSTNPESSWTTRTSNFGVTRINALTFGGNLFLAGGDSGQLRTSTDAITWTTRTSGFGSSAIRALSWNGSLFIAAGAGGNLTTSTDGVTWTARTSNMGGNDILCITPSQSVQGYLGYVPAVGVAIGGKNGAFATSTDGITWTTRYVPYMGVSIQDIIYNGTEYFAMGGYATGRFGYNNGDQNYRPPYTYSQNNSTKGPVVAFKSTDGATWSTVELGNNLNAISTSSGYGNPYIVYNNGAYLYSESPGNVWSSTNGSFTRIKRSTDTVTWTSHQATGLASGNPAKLSVANNLFFAMGVPSTPSTTNLLSRSTDGITWTTTTTPVVNFVREVLYLNNQYFLLNISGGVFYTSTDLNFWTARYVSNENIRTATYDSSTSKYIIFGRNGNTYTSSDLLTWTATLPLGYINPHKVTNLGAGKFLVETNPWSENYTSPSQYLYASTTGVAYNSERTLLYGDPINGWMPTVATAVQYLNKMTNAGYAYRSSDGRIVSSIGPLELQYGTLTSGTVSFGTSVPTFISLYSTDQGVLN